MNRKFREYKPYIMASVNILIALLIIWQTMNILTATGRTFFVNRQIAKFDDETKSDEGKGEPEKPQAPGEPGQNEGAQEDGKPEGSSDKPDEADGKPEGPENPENNNGENPPPPAPEPEDDKYQEINKKGLFSRQQEQPLVCTGIIGRQAIINNQLVKVGESAGKWKVVEISNNKVVIESDGNKKEIKLFPELPTK